MRSIFTFSISFLILSSSLFAQTGPGGVGSSATNQLWLDANRITGLTSGSRVNPWVDVSGNGNNATQSLATRNRPFYITNVLNSKPVVRFDGVDDFLQTPSIPALNTNQLTWFMVSSAVNNQTGVLIRSSYTGGSSSAANSLMWGTFLSTNNNSYNSNARSADNINSPQVNLGYQGGFNILSTVWRGSTSQLEGYRNGSLSGTDNNATANPTGHQYIRIGANSGNLGLYLAGDVAEAIVYSMELNQAQRVIVDNYLAAKYGLTMSGNDRYAFDATHGNEVAGIGQESGSGNYTARGTGIVTVSNPTLADGQYFLFGHNNTALSSTQTTDVPTSGSVRLTRTWRASNTGGIGTVDVSFNLTGITFGDPADYRLLVDDDGTFANATEISTGMSYDAGTNTVTFAGASIPDGRFFTLSTGAIVSVNTGNWNTASTWSCNCVPTTANNVKINNPHTVTANTDAGVDSLTILNGGTLLITNATVFTALGGITNNGTFNASGTSEVVLSGTDNQTLSGSGIFDFFGLTLNNGPKSIDQVLDVNGNLTINNPATLDLNGFDVHLAGNLNATTAIPFFNNTGTFVFNGFPPQTVNASGTIAFFNVSSDNVTVVELASGAYTVNGALEVKNGSTFNVNGRMTILSDASRTGIIGEVNGTLGGSLTVQRFLSARDSGYVELSSPITNSTIADWDAELYMYGVGGSDGGGVGTATTVYTYSEAAWDYVRVTSQATALTPGKGFDVFLTTNTGTLGDFLGATLTTVGPANQGTISLSSPAITNVNDGWNLVGNPYAAFINWSTVQAASTNIAANYQVYDDVIRNFRTFGGGTEIAPGHGFWIEATGAPTLTFTETAKTFSAGSTFMKKTDPFAGIKLTLSNDQDPYAHIFKVELNNDASEERDNYDASFRKTRDPRSPSITTALKDGRKLVLTAVPAEETVQIPLQVNTGRSGKFKFTCEGLQNYPEYTAFLIDNQLNTKTKLNKSNVVTFNAENSNQNERFELVLTKNEASLASITPVAPVILERTQDQYFVTMDNLLEEKATVYLHNSLGQMIDQSITIVKGQKVPVHVPDSKQIYLVTLVTESGKTFHAKVSPY